MQICFQKNKPLNRQLLCSLTGKAGLKKYGWKGADSYQFPETNGAMGRAALLRLSLNCSSGRESAPISYEIPRIVSRLTSAATIKWGFETVSAARPSYPAAQQRRAALCTDCLWELASLAHSLTKRPLDMAGWLLFFENELPKSNCLSREGLRSPLQSVKRFQITELNLSRRCHRPECNPPASHPEKQYGRPDCRRSHRPRPGS